MGDSLSGNDIGVYLSKQTAQGAIDANPVFLPFRRTEGKMRQNTSYVQSTEVKNNRQARENVQDTVDFAGDLSFEMTEQSIPLLLDTIQNTETARTATEVTISSDANGFVDSGGAAFTTIDVNDFIFIDGFSDARLNRAYYVTAKNSNGDVETSPAPSVVEAEGASVTMTSNRTFSGSVRPYYTVQTRIFDDSKTDDLDYETFFDGTTNSASFEVAETGIVSGSLNILAGEKVDSTAAIAGQTDDTADTSSVVGSVNDINRFWVNGVDSDCTVKSMGFEFSNNLIEDRAAACPGAQYANGDMSLSGALVARLPRANSLTWRDRYQQGTRFGLAVEIKHSATRTTVIEIGRAVVTEHEIPDGSNVVANSDMTYTAEEDSRGVTVAVYRNWA